MIKNILLSLLICSQAFAGLPPTTLKGQGGSNVTTFGFQVPLNQATQVSGVNSLIETGNGNSLPNPGFEGTTGWTASGGATAAINTTAVGTGVNGYDWDSNSASQTLRGTAITIPNSWKGQLGIVECFIKTPSGSATHTLGVYDGSSLLSSTTVNSNSIFVPSQHFFTFPSSGTITPQLTSVASNEPEIYIDDCYIGLLSRHPAGNTSAAITGWTQYTPTFTGFGTVSTQSFYYRQVGDSLEIHGRFITGTVTATEARVSLPTGCTSVSQYTTLENAGTWVRSATATTHGGLVLIEPSVSYFTFSDVNTFGGGSAGVLAKQNGNASFGSTDTVVIDAKVRCTGLASVVNQASTSIITAFTSYTPTFTGFGTVSTQSFRYRQVGSTVQIEGRFLVGTPTATEARVTLPTVCSSAASDYVTLEHVGVGSSTETTNNIVVLVEPSSSYLTFGTVTAARAGLTKQNGNSVISAGGTLTFNATVRCTGMPGVIPAPNYVGYATNNGSSAIRIEGASLAAPSAGSCAVTEVGGSDWIDGNCTSGATGVCTCTLKSGIFSSAPKCQISIENLAAANSRDEQITSTSTSTIVTFTATTGGTAVNNDVFIMCMGVR